jgi:hypothetical protein
VAHATSAAPARLEEVLADVDGVVVLENKIILFSAADALDIDWDPLL